MTDKVDEALKMIVEASQDCLLPAAEIIVHDARQRTPVDRGDLRRSAYVRRQDANTVIAGYTAPYAMRVHNARGTLRGRPRPAPHRGRFWDPVGSEPRFLSNALEQNKSEVLQRISAEIKRRLETKSV